MPPDHGLELGIERTRRALTIEPFSDASSICIDPVPDDDAVVCAIGAQRDNSCLIAASSSAPNPSV